MSPALRLLRLDSILALLGRSLARRGERLEDALDTLLDAAPAQAAVAFTPDRRGQPLAERRMPAKVTDAIALRARLWQAAEQAISSGNARALALPANDEGTPAQPGETAAALPIHVGSSVGAVLVLLFSSRAMLDEETLRYLTTTARVTELALERDAAADREQRLRADVDRAAEELTSAYDELERTLVRAKTLSDPDDRALAPRSTSWEATRGTLASP